MALMTLIFGACLFDAAAMHEQSWPLSVIEVLLMAVVFARTAYAAVVIGPDELVVRNVFRTVTVPWSDVSGFTLGRYQLLSMVCLVHLTDGTTLHASGIQGTGLGGNQAHGLVQRLNAFLAARGTPAPRT